VGVPPPRCRCTTGCASGLPRRNVGTLPHAVGTLLPPPDRIDEDADATEPPPADARVPALPPLRPLASLPRVGARVGEVLAPRLRAPAPTRLMSGVAAERPLRDDDAAEDAVEPVVDAGRRRACCP
jgi:hypothetical protein